MNSDLGHAEPSSVVAPLPIREWNSLVHGFVDKAVFFANQNRDPQDIHDAWRTFRVWLSSWIDYNSDDWRLFLVWYVFHWQPLELALDREAASGSIAEQYAKAFPEEVSTAERRMIVAATTNPLDFYEIYEFPELGCYYVKSLFLGYQHSYAFNELPEGLNVGDIFFGKLVHFKDDRGVIAGHSRPFPATAKIAIAYMRRHLIKDRKEEFITNFALFDSDLFNLYHDLLDGKDLSF